MVQMMFVASADCVRHSNMKIGADSKLQKVPAALK